MQDALMQQQMELERLYNKNQLIPRISAEFEETDGFLDYLESVEMPAKFAVAMMTQMVLHKRCKVDTMVGILRPHFEDVQDVADGIEAMIQLELVAYDERTNQLVLTVDISLELQHELELYQFPLPMVVKPEEVKTNKDVGYLTSKGSIILKKNHHTDDVCLDHINRMNSILFSLDVETATMVRNQWRNLDKPKDGETKEDFEKRKRAFDKYDRTAYEVMDVLWEHGNQFHLTHKYDKRGRVYSQGYHVNYQGTDWNKAVIQLAEPEMVEC